MVLLRKCFNVLKNALSLLVASALILSLLPAAGFGLGTVARAAGNEGGTVVDNKEDVFAALGFDTDELPEGFDAETTDNPYGRDRFTGNQVFEVLLATSGGTAIYGNNDNSVLPSALSGHSTQGSVMPAGQLFAGAPGDFDGDGLQGEVAYVGIDHVNYGVSTAANLILYLYDAAARTYSSAMTLGSVSPYYTTTPGDLYQTYIDAAWQNLLQITTGDYDGDGRSEIAVYVAESGNARVDIYKYQLTSDSPENDWLTMDDRHWSRMWSYAVSASADSVPNMVSLVSGDFNRDGVDDLGISYGSAVFQIWPIPDTDPDTERYFYTSRCLEHTASRARILWGGTSGMLQINSALDLGEEETGSLARVSLCYGDADADGTKDLIMAGQSVSDLAANDTRSVAIYAWDESAGLVITASETLKVVEIEYQTTFDDEGNPSGTEPNSTNGYDMAYLSAPVMRCNVAVVTPDRSGDTYVYVDSTMCRYYESSFAIAYELDDGTSCDGNTTETTLMWAGANNLLFTLYNDNLENEHIYCEYGAVSGDINGSGNNILMTNYLGTSSKHPAGDGSTTSIFRGSYRGYCVLCAGGDAGVAAVNQGTRSDGDSPQPVAVAITMPDTDTDTTLIEYTGIHYLTYSDPKVLAVVSAAPYFEDIDIVTGHDFAWANNTSWATTSGSGRSVLVSVGLEAGVFGNIEATIGGGHMESSLSCAFTFEWERSTTKTTEYTLVFEASDDEDSIAFYCIPTECYVYNIYVPDGKGGYTEISDIITNSFSPCFQILSLDYYESIQGDYDALPPIAGKAITSTPGDPSSYPSSTSSYDVIAEWNQDPAGVSFGSGMISQEIAITEEESNTYNFGAAVEFRYGCGGKGWSDLAQSGGEVSAGVYLALNSSGGYSEIDLSGTTISGTVYNMPIEFQDYGYYYTWKLFSYEYEFEDGTSVPVVSYVVGDVSEPPKLPSDFRQDFARTTTETNCLTWTYGDSVSTFHLYRYFDFPEGGGLHEIAEIAAGDPAHYSIKYDAGGKAYKEFYYLDENLSAYTEYDYCIQVERTSPVPPLSVPSAILTARTKAASGNPIMTVTESDGGDDAALLIYPDKNSHLTVAVTGPDGQLASNYYTTVQYQWQKLEAGVWTELDNETYKTLTFAGAGISSAGVYRCRVNVLTKEDAQYLSAYTDSVAVSHSKRSAYISEVHVNDSSSGGIELYAEVTNAHPDSGTVPSGTVLFTLASERTGMNYQFAAELDAVGVADVVIDVGVPRDIYNVYAYYSGSYVFKPSAAACVYLSDMDSGFAIDTPAAVTYGDGGSLSFLKLSKSGGVSSAESVNAVNVSLYAADTAAQTSLPRARVLGNGVVKGNRYQYTTVEGDIYFFTATRTGPVTTDGKYVYYSTVPVTGCLSEAGSPGVYALADTTPAGGYVVKMTADDGSAWNSCVVRQREVTLQLPDKVGSEGTDEEYPRLGELLITSGSWADCDCTGGELDDALAATAVTVTYTNTAGETFTNLTVDNTCGYYITKSASLNTLLENYAFSFLDGSVSILGTTYDLLVGARRFEDADVGTVYVISPDYAYTRAKLTYNSVQDKYYGDISLNYQAGTRTVLYAVADPGYEVSDWYVNGSAQNNASTSFACVMFAEDCRVEVQFTVKRNTLVFGTVGDAGGGTLSCSDTALTSGSIVMSNSTFTFTANANEGYHFKEWRYTEFGSSTAYDDEDAGKAGSVFHFTMPLRSCTLYAVFERDFYTLSLNDLSGNNGLTAYYYASSGDSTASMEKIWISGTASVKGGTEIVVQPAAGYLLDEEYAYVSEGSQGTADYSAGTYSLTILEHTTVTCATTRQAYGVTLKFDVASSSSQPSDAVILCTAAGEESVYRYADGDSFTIAGLSGGSSITAEGSCASYYEIEGWESSLTSPVAAVTSSALTEDEAAWQSLAAAIENGGEVEKGSVYRYTYAAATYYFMATESGKVRIDGPDMVHIIAQGDGFSVPELGSAVTLTLYLREKQTHTVTLYSVANGTYSYALPEGATKAAEGDHTVVTLHDGDSFSVTVSPVSGQTVTYWEVSYEPAGIKLTSKYRATSATYTLVDIGYDYEVTPLFASTTYNTVSWPTIGSAVNGITLTPIGCLSSVASGSCFTFKLEGSENALALIDKVFANGYEFIPGGNVQAGSTYSYDPETGYYSISDITANQVVTLMFNEIGVTVNGTDISAMSGTGWNYDVSSQKLTVSGSNRILSGTNQGPYAPNLTVILDADTGTVTFDNLKLVSGANGVLVSSERTTGVSITATGSNSLTSNNSSTSSAILLYTADNLTVRGSGSLTLNLNREFGTAATKAVSCNGEFFITGTVDMTVNAHMAEQHTLLSSNIGLWCDKLTVGVQDSQTSAPSLKVYMYGQDGKTLDSAYISTGIHCANDTMTVWSGSLLVCAAIGLDVPGNYIRNYGGSAEICSLAGAVLNAQTALWEIDYTPDGSAGGSGFLVCFGDSSTDFTTATYDKDDSVSLDGYDPLVWTSFAEYWRGEFGFAEGDENPLEAKYLRIDPITDGGSRVTMDVTNGFAEYTGAVVSSSGDNAGKTYYCRPMPHGVLVLVEESEITYSDYVAGTEYLAKYDDRKLLLEAYELILTETYVRYYESLPSGLPVTEITGSDDYEVFKGQWYHHKTANGGDDLYFTPEQNGMFPAGSVSRNISNSTIEIMYVTAVSAENDGFGYTLHGVDDGLDIESVSATALTLNGLTAGSMVVGNRCSEFEILGNNYLVGSVPEQAILKLNCSGDTFSISSDGAGTLSVINTAPADGYGIHVNSAGVTDLRLVNVKSLSAYGSESAVNGSNDMDISYYDAVSRTDGVYGYGWVYESGTSSADAEVVRGVNIGRTSVSRPRSEYVRFYSATADADCTNPLTYDINTEGTSTLSSGVYCPAVTGRNHVFSSADPTCSVKLSDIAGTETLLACGTDYTLTPQDDGSSAFASGTLTLATEDGSAFNSGLALGDYTILVNFHDEDPADATYYTLEIPLTVKNSHTSETGWLSIAPSAKILPRGGSCTFTASFSQTTPKSYRWYYDGSEIAGRTGVSYDLTIDGAAAFKQYLLTVEAYAEDGTKLGTANADIIVVPQATQIAITCATETPSGDGSYTLYHNDQGSWDFDASVTLDSGETDANVTWTLWGSKMRATAIDSDTGALVVVPNETGTNGTLKLTASYANADGTIFSKTVVIWLSTDARVSYSNADALNGAISSVVYGEAQNAIPSAGAWIPAGSLVSAKAAPDTEYAVHHWYVNGVNVMDNDSYTVSKDGNTLAFTAASMGNYAITADYVNKYNVEVTYSARQNGSLTASYNNEAFVSGQTVLKNSSVSFTATPDTYYQVACWYVDGEIYEEPAGTAYTGTMLTLSEITEGHTVSVEFEGVPVTVTFVAGINVVAGTGSPASPNGTMVIFDDGNLLSATPHPETDHSLTYAATVNAVSEINILAIPASGYQVKGWYIWSDSEYIPLQNSAAVANYYLDSITDDLKVKVEFEPIPVRTVTVSVNSYQKGGGSVVSGVNSVSTSGSLDISVSNHDDLTLLANADAGSYLYEWRVTGSSYNTDGDAITLTDITADTEVAAVFRKLFYEVTLRSGAGGEITASYDLGTDLSGGVIADDGTAEIKSGSTVTVTITPDAGYAIESLTVNGAQTDYTVSGGAGSYTYTYTIGSLLGDAQIGVTFTPCVFHNVTVPAGDAFSAAISETEYAPAGAVSASFVNDGFSKDEDAQDNTVEILSGGSARLTVTPASGATSGGTDYCFTVNVDALRTAVNDVIEAEVSGADYGIYIDHGSYCVEITGIDKNLDFSSMANPFVIRTAEAAEYAVQFNFAGNGGMEATYNGVGLSSGSTIPEGAEVVFTMTPDAHHDLTLLTVDAADVLDSAVCSGGKYTFTAVVNGTLTVDAGFEVSEHYVRISVVGSGGGVVTVEAGGKLTTSGGYLPANHPVSISAAPDTNSSFNCMSVNGTDAAGGTYSLASLDADVSIVAVFDAVSKPVTYNAPTNGTLKVTDSAGNVISSGSSVAVGSILVITATPDEHYALSALTAGGAAVTGNTYIVNATRTNTIFASFAATEVPVDWEIPTGGLIKVYDAENCSITNGSYLAVGSTIRIFGVASEYYEFESLTLNGISVENGSQQTVSDKGVSLSAVFDCVLPDDDDDGNGGSDGGGGDGVSESTAGEINVMTSDLSLAARGTVTVTATGVTVEVVGESFAQLAERTRQTGVGITFDTDLAVVILDSDAVTFIDGVAGSKDVVLEIEKVDPSTLSEESRRLIGNHPVYDFALTADSVQMKSFSGGKATVSVPYTLKAGETPQNVVVYYIDDNNELQIIRGAYHAETGTVDFVVRHFSLFALGSNPVEFTDVEETNWYYEAVAFIAAREITLGVGGNMYGPANNITRGEFLVMLMRAYGIEPDGSSANNFSDAGDTYYTDYLAAARLLGITNGIGDNLYAPDRSISRQEMFTMLYRALAVLGELPEAARAADLTAFADSAMIADYAREALTAFVSAGVVSGSDGKLRPDSVASRAEMAQLLYNLLSKSR